MKKHSGRTTWCMDIAIAMILLGGMTAHAGVGALVKKPVEWAVKKTTGKVASAGMKESVEQAIRKACRTLGNEAVELAVKHGDDAARVLAKHGDDAARLIRTCGDDGVKVLLAYGDDAVRLAARHGDDAIRVLARNGSTMLPMVSKYGDDAAVAFIQHPGLGKELVEAFGRNAGAVAGKVTDDGAVVLAKCMSKASEQEARIITREVLVQTERKTGKEILDMILRRTPHVAAAAGILILANEAGGSVHDVRAWAQTAPEGHVASAARGVLWPLALLAFLGIVLIKTTPKMLDLFLNHRRLAKAAASKDGVRLLVCESTLQRLTRKRA